MKKHKKKLKLNKKKNKYPKTTKNMFYNGYDEEKICETNSSFSTTTKFVQYNCKKKYSCFYTQFVKAFILKKKERKK